MLHSPPNLQSLQLNLLISKHPPPSNNFINSFQWTSGRPSMDNNRTRGKKRSHQPLNVLAKKPPYFFKVVFSPVDQGIKIPTAFMREYGDSLEKVVVLKVPTGTSWSVELHQNDVGTWLDKGWRQFAEYYSIEKRHFLVLKYDGNSQFHVIIFDPSSSEIEYPIEAQATPDHDIHDDEDQLPRRTSRMRRLDEIESDDDSIQILYEIPAASCPPNQRKRSAHDRIEKANLEKLDEDVSSVGHRLRQRRIKKESFEGMPISQSSNVSTETGMDKSNSIAFQRAKAFTSKNPFFIRFMQPSYVTNTFGLFFSLLFAKEYLTQCKHCNLDLRVSGRAKTWPVKCTLRTGDAKMRQGWKEFVLDNSLVVGDVCVFELIRGTRMFNITIYRRN